MENTRSLSMSGHSDDEFATVFETRDDHAQAHLYGIVDAAQDKYLLELLSGKCLFDYDQRTTVADVSPHLVHLPDRSAVTTWHRIDQHAAKRPCLIILSSTLSFEDLFEHLQSFLDVRVNASTSHFLAYWDPMILMALIGQPDDDTLYVKGPVFDEAQREEFLQPIHDIWYWDRCAQLRHVAVSKLIETVPAPAAPHDVSVWPLTFDQVQVRQIVQASTPDHVLYELRLNRPGVLADRTDGDNYTVTCSLLDVARDMDIKGLQDLVNFVGTGMILGENFHQHPLMQPYLVSMRESRKSFTDTLQQVPAAVLQRVMDDAKAQEVIK